MDAIDFRRHLHRYPELSFKEYDTAQFISKTLSYNGIEHRTIAQTGILAKVEGQGDLTRAIILRADIDALPITEQNDIECASQNCGVMHACGHDIHAAILFGAVLKLSKNPNFEGTIFALFQPGEECNPGGASLVIAENPFEGYNIIAAIAEHVDGDIEVGSFGLRKGLYMASGDELRFSIDGVGGHAALRHKLKDPVAATAKLITQLLSLNSPDVILSIGRVEANGATNVIPSSVHLEGTLRTYSEEQRLAAKQKIRSICEQIATNHELSITPDICEGYPTIVNNEKLVDIAQQTIKESGYRVEQLDRRPTTEDFGYFTQLYPSLFYRIGVGRQIGAPHTSTFNPDERAIPVGIDLMTKLAYKLLTKKE